MNLKIAADKKIVINPLCMRVKRIISFLDEFNESFVKKNEHIRIDGNSHNDNGFSASDRFSLAKKICDFFDALFSEIYINSADKHKLVDSLGDFIRICSFQLYKSVIKEPALLFNYNYNFFMYKNLHDLAISDFKQALFAYLFIDVFQRFVEGHASALELYSLKQFDSLYNRLDSQGYIEWKAIKLFTVFLDLVYNLQYISSIPKSFLDRINSLVSNIYEYHLSPYVRASILADHELFESILSDSFWDIFYKFNARQDYTKMVKFYSSVFGDANCYEPTPYLIIGKLIRYSDLSSEDIVLDVGSGSGRVINVLSNYKIKKVIGLELDRSLVTLGKRNLEQNQHRQADFEIVQEDAANYSPNEATIVFLFNPFKEATLRKFLGNLVESFYSNPRKIQLVYYIPLHTDVIEEFNVFKLKTNFSVDHHHVLIWEAEG